MITDFQAEEKFYSKKFSFSYSSLNKLLFVPNTFYKHYILGEREDRLDSHLVEGRALHCLLLEPEVFNDQFVVSLATLPGDNARKVIDKVYALSCQDGCEGLPLSSHELVILDILREINLHQSLKTDQQRVDKVLTAENVNYYEFLKSKGSKTVIDQETYDKLRGYVEIIFSTESVTSLLQLGSPNSKSEVPLEADTKYGFGLKGIIDNYVYDPETKVVTINDFKTTGKTISEFKETVDYYKYWMQAAMYYKLIEANFKGLSEIRFNFIVIDKYQQVFAFPVCAATLHSWVWSLDEILEKANYHYTNRRYDLPYEFLVNNVTL
jgi:hypothetical protein